MIGLTSADVSVILKHAGAQAPEYLPTAELNDDGQTEIVRWIETVGKLDDQLTPYAWFSLAEEAAASHDPEEQVMIEMLPMYTLSGESEMLELSRERHFDWSIEVVPLEYIQNADELLEAGVPFRFLLLAEVAGNVLAKHVSMLCPEAEMFEPQLAVRAMNTVFEQMCEGAGIAPDEMLHSYEDEDELSLQQVEEEELEAAIEQGIEAAREAVRFLDSELDASLYISPDSFLGNED